MERNYGFMRVATATLPVRVADCPWNLAQHVRAVRQMDAAGVQLLLFPELSLTGYTCADLFHQPVLLRAARAALQDLVAQTAECDIAVCVGLPFAYGNHIYNVAAMFHRGRVVALVPKTYLPAYNEFYEPRWFASGADIPAGTTVAPIGSEESLPLGTDLLVRIGEATVGIEICEDLWVPIPPSSRQAVAGADVLLNLSASDEVLGKHAYLRQMIATQSGRLIAAYLYASAGFGESSTDLVFAGKGFISENGSIIAESTCFDMGATFCIADIDIERLQVLRRRQNTFTDTGSVGFCPRVTSIHIDKTPDYTARLYRHIDPHPFVPTESTDKDMRCREIFAIQVAGLATRLQHIQAKTAVIGISGGLDSTLALLVAVQAFDRLAWDRRRIIGITMPGFGTSGRTHSNSLALMETLGITRREIGIAAAVTQHFADLGIDAAVHDTTYENCQARERTQILMDVANQTGGIVVGTGDLSELALGWCTYNGDHISMYGVNAGVPKTLVRHLVQWCADTWLRDSARATLLDIIATPISPELIPTDSHGDIAQRTEDLVGPYELHDFFLYHSFRFGASPQKVFFLARHAFGHAYDAATLRRWLRNFYHRFFSQQFKRSCMPDGPKVGTVSLSPRGDWRMPSDAQARIWIDEADALAAEQATTASPDFA